MYTHGHCFHLNLKESIVKGARLDSCINSVRWSIRLPSMALISTKSGTGNNAMLLNLLIADDEVQKSCLPLQFRDEMSDA